MTSDKDKQLAEDMRELNQIIRSNRMAKIAIFAFLVAVIALSMWVLK